LEKSWMEKGFYQRVIKLIKEIPYGHATTYGTIATLAGSPRAARIVGGILHSSTEKEDLPWQRVVNRDGYISIKSGLVDSKNLQKQLLEEEGIEVSSEFMVDLNRYGWWGSKN
jgi:methylated-DNA-protein-cysteine methyltransferase-like protein